LLPRNFSNESIYQKFAAVLDKFYLIFQVK
jgi:hypothetical protein